MGATTSTAQQRILAARRRLFNQAPLSNGKSEIIPHALYFTSTQPLFFEYPGFFGGARCVEHYSQESNVLNSFDVK